MRINVEMTDGKTFQIPYQADKTTVNDVKKKVMEKQGIRLDQLVLLFKDQILSNEKLLMDYGIQDKAIIEAETVESLQEHHKQKLEKLQNEVQRWQERFRDEETQKEELQEKSKKAFIDSEKIQQEKTNLELEFSQLKSQLEAIQKKNAEFKQKQQVQSQDVDVKNLEQELATKKATITMMEIEKTELKSQISYLKQEKQDLQKKLEDYQKLKEELIQKKLEIKKLERDLEDKQNLSKKTDYEINKNKDNFNNQIKFLEQQLQEAKKKNEELEIEKVKQQYQSHIGQQQNEQLYELQQINTQLERRLGEYKASLFSLNEQMNLLKSRNQEELISQIKGPALISAEKFQGQDLQISKLSSELKAALESLNESQNQLQTLKQKYFECQNKIRELEKKEESVINLQKEQDRGVKQRDQTIKFLQQELQELNNYLSIYQQKIRDYEQKITSADPKRVMQIDNEILKVEERLKAKEEQRMKEYQNQELQRQKELQDRKDQMIQEQQINNQFMQKTKEQRQRTAQFLKQQMMESHGKIEVCFLIDVTGSMDPYKDQTMNCIVESMRNIKIKTNRDVLWATVAYQDFGELKQLGTYMQLGFTPDAEQIKQFLGGIKCQGGGDVPEDIRGGIKQMINKLKWSKTFKIAVLICDAPTHGVKYNGGQKDRYPEEDIEDAINLLIENNILFVAILFNKITLSMFEQIKKIYQKADKDELLLFANLENVEQGKIWQELVDLVSQASQRATQTNNKGTKAKNNDAKIGPQEGAIEALCKQIKDPSQFDKIPGIKIIQVKFDVQRLELKQDSFETNIENIRRLDIKRDYAVYPEGQWDCLRTEKCFAKGQMKQVFLMKRQNNQNELYVIKMPLGDKTYSSLEQAIIECRSHLISKCLMKRFIRDLLEQRDRIDRSIEIPQVQYSDFLILKDMNQINSFWIAERYFPGEFVKYNNNFGFISDENTDINHLAQAFTYYTYFISNFNYMVNDIQGVGNYFTDPALNTKDINFDSTDMGLDGQSMYVVSYQGKKHIGRKYLDLLKIYV